MSMFKDMLKSGETLFRDTVVLDYDFQPKIMKYRETEQKQFAIAIRPLLQGHNGRNLFVYGVPGVGKTTACKHVLRELEEETGYKANKEELINLGETNWKFPTKEIDFPAFRINLETQIPIKIQKKEHQAYKWVTAKEAYDMNKDLIHGLKDLLVMLKYIKNIKSDYATKYLNKTVTIKMDRPKGSKHPSCGYIYPINYGFVPNTKAPDGHEVDAYILNEKEPLKEFTGTCIAVIHRTNDDDDKLIVVKEGTNLTDEEIKKQTDFQEQFFKSIIIRH